MQPALPELDDLGLGANDRSFLSRVYADGLVRYQDRLGAVGLSDRSNVLDAGAGFGQWTLALASMNGAVTAMDADHLRVRTISRIADSNGIRNVSTLTAGLDAMPFAADSFDGAICYGAIFYVDPRRAIDGFSHCLGPGAILYISCNDWGRVVHDIVRNPNATAGFSPRRRALRTLGRTTVYETTRVKLPGPVPVPARRLGRLLEASGFEVIALGAEGTLRLDDRFESSPNFEARFMRIRSVYDCIARRHR